MNMENIKEEVDDFLLNYFNSRGTYNKIIFESMGYSLNVGGKRIRPILLLLTYSIYKGEHKDIIPVAAALEMIHTYSLIHDDLPCMDDDNLRRGMPTNHIKFSYPIAVLAGDGLLNEAMSVMLHFCIGKGQEFIKACSLIADCAGADGMIGGQVVDILSEGRKISEEQLLYMHRNKTGALIKASILAGGILGKAEESDLEILSQYGDKLGLAFQIKDDILDVTETSETLGKNAHSDEDNNKTTFVTLYGVEECKNKCKELTKECNLLLKSLNKNTKNLEKLTEFLLNRQF